MEHPKASPLLQKEIARTTTSTTRKIREYITFIVLAVVIATAFFLHEGIPLMPEEYYPAETKWEAARSENAKALGALKRLNAELYQGRISPDEFAARQPALMEAYNRINKEKNKLYKIAMEAQAEAKVLQFRSIHFFLGELGWAVGLFLYALVNLFNTFYLKARYVKREFTGKILLHSTLLFIGCFYTAYVFYSKLDFSREWYILAMLLCTLSLVLASKYLTDSYIKRTEYLMESIRRLLGFIFRVRTKHYDKVSVKALYAERQNVVIDPGGDTVADNNKEFDKDFYRTLRKINL